MISITRKTKAPAKVLTPAQAERQREADLIAARAAAELRELEAAEELKELERLAARKDKIKELETKDKTVRSTEWSATVQLWTSRFVPFLPLVLVNTMAVFGQLGWGRHNLTQVGSSPDDLARWIIAALFAATLESIALFLAYYANRALDRGDSATALYLAAFTVAGIVAGVNYSHYASPEKISVLGLVTIPGPSAMAVVFAMCSVASPWLWRIKHRDANRNKLHALGVIDSKAVRLSMARKIFYPFRSFQVTRLAVWDGVTSPAEAVANWESVKAAKAARKAEDKAAKDAQKAQKATRAPEKAVEAPEVQDELESPQEPAQPALGAPKAPELPQVAQKFPAAWEALTKTHEAGNPISQRALAANYLNGNRHHARDLIKNHTEWRLTSVNGSRPSA